VDMASYRQGTFSHGDKDASSPQGHPSPAPSPQAVYEVRGQAVTAQDYANLLQWGLHVSLASVAELWGTLIPYLCVPVSETFPVFGVGTRAGGL